MSNRTDWKELIKEVLDEHQCKDGTVIRPELDERLVTELRNTYDDGYHNGYEAGYREGKS